MPRGPKVDSPCIGVCSIDERNGFCAGCFRSAREVADWLYLNDEQKRQVLTRLPARRGEGVGS